MLAWLKRVGFIAACIFALLFAIGLLLPTDYHVSRSIVVEASSGEVHELVGDLGRWPEWGPWQQEDPTLKTLIGGKSQGVGASQSWTGDSGNGELTFTQVDPQVGVEYDLTFIEGDNKLPSSGYVHYRPLADKTEVTWGMKGDLKDGPLGIRGYFASTMDLFVGGMFERGLERLKARAEAD